MGIFDVFKQQPNTQQQPQNNQQQPQQNNQQQQKQPPQNSSGSQMIDQTQQRKDGGEGNVDQNTSPLEPYKDLWQDAPVEKDAQGNPVTKTPSNDNKVQGPDFAKIAKTLDFTRILNQELVAKALGGDQAAFGQVLNSVVQASVAASAKMSHQVATKLNKDSLESFKSTLPAEFKKFSVAGTPLKNEGMKHPAARPIVEAIRAQFSEKYPELSAEEATVKAEDYLQASFKHMFPVKDAESEAESGMSENTKRIATQSAGTFNWDEFIKV